MTEDHEQKIKGLRAEIEASYRDKLSFLQNGMEEKHRKVLERSKLERDFDIKSLTEKHHREMELMKAAHLSEIEALQTQLQEIRVPDTCAADDFSVKANAQDQHEENVTPSDGAPVDSDFTQSTCVSPGDVDTSENLVTETENTMELRTGDGSGDKRYSYNSFT